jgi:hypothetical protein
LSPKEVECGGKKVCEGIFSLKKGAQIKSENNLLCGVGLRGISKSGLGMAPTYRSSVVALSAFDLGFKTAEEGSTKRFRCGTGESDNVGGRNPVQISPNFTSVHLLRQGRGRQISQSLEASEQDSDMGFMSVGWVMKIENLGSGNF